ncbi:hypothetical protein R1flu_026550 [Riccia fluitans]|uniref:Uncharacterized protein n=1 Tax=Riccia fluitans TaxID=41844 RepID=A0ABD1XG94_9MARC
MRRWTSAAPCGATGASHLKKTHKAQCSRRKAQATAQPKERHKLWHSRMKGVRRGKKKRVQERGTARYLSKFCKRLDMDGESLPVRSLVLSRTGGVDPSSFKGCIASSAHQEASNLDLESKASE